MTHPTKSVSDGFREWAADYEEENPLTLLDLNREYAPAHSRPDADLVSFNKSRDAVRWLAILAVGDQTSQHENRYQDGDQSSDHRLLLRVLPYRTLQPQSLMPQIVGGINPYVRIPSRVDTKCGRRCVVGNES